MASIGTDGRDHADIPEWEAALGSGAQVGDMYADSDFEHATTVTINDADPSSTTLKPADGESPRILSTGNDTPLAVQSTPPVILGSLAEDSWLDIDMNGFNDATGVLNIAGGGAVRRCKIHGQDTGSGAHAGIIAAIPSGFTLEIIRDWIYNIGRTEGAGAARVDGIIVSGLGTVNIDNVTVDNCFTVGTGAAYCFSVPDDADYTIRNCVGTRATGGSGGSQAFEISSYSNATASNNASDDSSAPSPIAAEPVVASTEFTSLTGGSEDYHLKSGAECIDAGADLGTSTYGRHIDWDGRDVDAEADTWDVGADEFVAAGGGAVARHNIGFGMSGRVIGG